MKKFLALCALLVLSNFPGLTPTIAQAAALDYDIPNGHFYTQAAGGDGVHGFAIVDDGTAKFWTEFQRLGGVGGVGYPVSKRFIHPG